MFRPALAVCALLAACASHPETGADAYPSLLPIDSLLTDPAAASDPATGLDARAAALRARADALRAPVIPPDSPTRG